MMVVSLGPGFKVVSDDAVTTFVWLGLEDSVMTVVPGPVPELLSLGAELRVVSDGPSAVVVWPEDSVMMVVSGPELKVVSEEPGTVLVWPGPEDSVMRVVSGPELKVVSDGPEAVLV